MNKGKQKCDKLKQVRKEIADQIGIDLHQKECTFSGECTGTCPKCKQEEDILNMALLKRAGIAALSAGVSFSLAACGTNPNPDDLTGIAAPETITIPDETTEPPTNEPLQGDLETIIMGDFEIDDEINVCENKDDEVVPDDEEDENFPEVAMGVAPYEPNE